MLHMPEDLQSEMMNLWDEARLLELTSRLDPTQATAMIQRLLNCADSARGAGYLFGERHLRRAAFELQERLRKSN
jgi:hypothetical protein